MPRLVSPVIDPPASNAMASLLVVEDQPSQQRMLVAGFEQRGYHVDVVDNGRAALDRAEALRPNLAIVDLGLPDMDGLEVCRHLILREVCPVIVVTADAVEDRMVDALDLGAEDYVVKPFSMNVLSARVRRALRPARAAGSGASDVDSSLLEVGDLRLDVAAHEAWVDGRAVHLQPLQFAVLTVLARNEGRVLTYQALAMAVYGEHAGERASVDALRTCVGSVRRRLGSGPRRPEIRTESRVGYRLVAPGTD